MHPMQRATPCDGQQSTAALFGIHAESPITWVNAPASGKLNPVHGLPLVATSGDGDAIPFWAIGKYFA
jgi:hypothetical protein